jgi:hypothetical protein
MALCVDHLRTTFPDCRAVDPATGERVNVEFEYRSKAFLKHRDEWDVLRRAHPRERWLMICWHDNLKEHQKEQLPGLQILSLRNLRAVRSLVLNWFPGDLGAPDAPRAMFQWRASALPQEKQAIIRRLQDFGEREPDFELQWPSEREFPKFIVWSKRRNLQCFSVSADGTLTVPFSKWRSLQAANKLEVIERLNRDLQTNWFSGRQKKKKGFDAETLLGGGRMVRKFLDVWRWFSGAPV